MFFSLENLSSSAVVVCKPWEYTRLDLVPQNCIEDKKARTLWINLPETRFSVFSAFEGVNGNQRVAREKPDGGGNPPLYHHAFIVDVDYPLSRVEIDAALGRMTLKPQWLEKSLSDNWRFIWVFEKAVMMPSFDFASVWLERLEEIIPFRQIAGIDEGAIIAPERYYTNGCRWEKISEDVIPSSRLLGLLHEVSAKFNWQSTGLAVPLDVAAVELAKKYPRFSQWEGDFVLDGSGPSFWIDGSTSPKSATVRATGIQTFSAHATKPFYSWSELLGHEFVKQYKLEEMGKAVEGIYFDGKNFIRKNLSDQWLWEDSTSLNLHLRVARGLTDKRSKGTNFSQIDSAVALIKDTAVIASAGSFAGYTKGLMHYNGNRYLNIHNRDVVQPSAEASVWGPGGKFPFISFFLSGFFSSPEQLPFFLSWSSRYYKSFQRRVPQSGQALLIFGRPGRGKTFLSEGILSELMGGSAEAKEWLNGEDIFNSELFDHVLWRIDDGSLSANVRSAGVYGEMLKRVTANKSFRSNEKYRKAGQVQWTGRIAITGNDDSESLRAIPNLDISMQEKVMLFRVAPDRTDGFKFHDDVEMRAVIAAELPYFARFLMDYQIPEHCRDAETRYGVRAYHEPSLRNAANHSSVSATFGEILDESLREYFTVREPHAEIWSGTSLQLHKMILSDGSLTEAMKAFNVQTVARNLSTLSAKKVFNIAIDGNEHRRVYTIHRDERFPRTKKVTTISHSDKYTRK